MAHNSDGVTNYRKIETLLLKATETFRVVFQQRWKSRIKSSWSDVPACGNLLTTTIGSKVYQTAHKQEKKRLKSGDINQWDLTLVCKVLTTCDFTNPENSKKTIKAENSRIYELLNIRNKHAHQASKSLTHIEFTGMWDKGITILRSFGISEIEIESLKNRKAENDTCVIAVEKIKTDGNALFNGGDIEGAIKIYSEGILFRGVINNDLAMLHSNRAAAYLEQQSASIIPKERALLALTDGLRTIEFKPKWWRGYQRVAQSYSALNELDKACFNYDKALELNDSIEEVRTANYDCRQRFEAQLRGDHLDPRQAPKCISDVMKNINQDSPRSMSFKELSQLEDYLCERGIDGGWVLKANRYKDGLDVEQNFEVAATLYAKAASKGNPEAILHLAGMTMKGKGVKQDFKLAMKLLNQGASLPPCFVINLDGSETLSYDDISTCQYALGLNYHTGVGVPQDSKLALEWYKKASDNGNSQALNTMGMTYSLGEWVPKDLKMAVKYWKMAVQRGDILATWSLANHYLSEDEPEKAIKWYKKAKEAEYLPAILEEQKFDEDIKESRLRRREMGREITSWEVENCLPIGDLSFKARLQRRDDVLYSRATEGNPKRSVDVKYQWDLSKKSLLGLEKQLSDGSITAGQIEEAFMKFTKGYLLILNPRLDFIRKLRAEGEKYKIMKYLADSFRSCIYITRLVSLDFIEVTYVFIQQCFTEIQDLNIQSEFEKDTRLCYTAMSRYFSNFTIKILQKSIHQYPKDVEFYIVYCSSLKDMGRYEHGLVETNGSLERFPKNCELLLLKSVIMRLLQTCKPKVVIEAYTNFLAQAPEDNINVPNSLYSIGVQFTQKSPADMNNARKYYHLGVSAEEKQLPLFTHCLSNPKRILQRSLNISQVDDSFEVPAESTLSTNVKSNTNDKELKPHLTAPRRVQIIVGHRESKSSFEGPAPPRTEDCIVRHHNCKQIFFQDMDPCSERYENCFLELTVIEDVYYNSSSIHFVVEDEKGAVQPAIIFLTVQNPIHTVQSQAIQLGSTMIVLNPRFGCKTKYGVFALNVSLNDMNVIECGDVRDRRCRLCRHLHSNITCSSCKVVNYCSRKCEEVDWKILKHKKICEWVNRDDEVSVHNERRTSSSHLSVFDPNFESDIEDKLEKSSAAPECCSDSYNTLSTWIVIIGVIIVGYKCVSR